MEAGPGRWVQQGQAGSLVVLAGHFPPSEQAQHGLSQAASGEFDGREGKATTVTMRGLLWGRLEGDRGWKAMLGQVWSLAMLAGHFPPPYRAQHGLPRAGKVHGGGRGQAAAKGGLQSGRLEGWPGPREKLGQAGSLARAVVMPKESNRAD
jgi:hypothetical protein